MLSMLLHILFFILLEYKVQMSSLLFLTWIKSFFFLLQISTVGKYNIVFSGTNYIASFSLYYFKSGMRIVQKKFWMSWLFFLNLQIIRNFELIICLLKSSFKQYLLHAQMHSGVLILIISIFIYKRSTYLLLLRSISFITMLIINIFYTNIPEYAMQFLNT